MRPPQIAQAAGLGELFIGLTVVSVGAVLGVTALVAPGSVPVETSTIRRDLPVMVVVALVLFPMVFTGARITRWEAARFLAYYATYVGYLLLDAAGHDALPALRSVLLRFLAPIAALVLAVLTVQEIHGRRSARLSASP